MNEDQDSDGNHRECKLLSGTFAMLMQALLGCIAISVLAYKRLHEVPQRPLLVWAFDAAKQMVGATFAHVANLFIAIVLYSHQDAIQADGPSVDQCALYFVNFTLDTTFGILLSYLFLSALVLVALRFGWSSLQTPGDYGTPVRVQTWMVQVLSWILVICVCKFVIALVIVAFQEPLGAFAALLFKPLDQSPDVELAIVMIACPCLMNALQFWIQDNFLKKDVRDESFIVAQVPASPTGKEKRDGKGGPVDTDTDDKDGDEKEREQLQESELMLTIKGDATQHEEDTNDLAAV